MTKKSFGIILDILQTDKYILPVATWMNPNTDREEEKIKGIEFRPDLPDQHRKQQSMYVSFPANYTKKWGRTLEGQRTKDLRSICSSEDSQQCQEEIDDIQIQRHRSPYVIVIGVTLNQVVCVIYNIPTEYDCCQKPIDHY